MAGGLWVLQANRPPLLTAAVVCRGVVVQFGVEVATRPPAQDVVKKCVTTLIPVTGASVGCDLLQRKHLEGRKI